MLATIKRRLGSIRLNRLLYRCGGATDVSRRRMEMLDKSIGKGMLDMRSRGMSDMSVCRVMLDMMRNRVISTFLVTFRHRNFKTLIQVSTLVIRQTNLMYGGLKLEH